MLHQVDSWHAPRLDHFVLLGQVDPQLEACVQGAEIVSQHVNLSIIESVSQHGNLSIMQSILPYPSIHL